MRLHGFSAFLSITLLSCFCPAAFAELAPLGLRAPTAEELAWRGSAARPASPVSDRGALPARVVNISHLPPVGRQVIGSCTSWAVCYYLKSHQEARERGLFRPLPPDAILSPAFVYNFVRASAPSGGSSFEGNFMFLLKHGTSAYADFPETGDVSQVPSVPLWKDAARRRANGLSIVDPRSPENLDIVKARLAAGDLAVTGMTVSANFDTYPYGEFIDNGVYFAASASGVRGNHALCIIGYDDARAYFNGTESRTGAFLIVNSWGTDWGVDIPESGGERGYLWVSYDYFLGGGSGNPWPVYLLDDRTGYDPSAFAIVSFEHGRPIELGLQLLGGRPEAPAAISDSLIDARYHMIDIELAVDVTDIYDPEIEMWTLQAMDYNIPQLGPVVNGTIRRFAMDVRGHALREASGTPLYTQDFVPNPLTNLYRLPIALFDSHERLGTSAFQASTAVGDWDADGDPDLAANGTLLRNDGGTWTPAGTAAPGQWFSAAFGDYNADGLPDLAVSGVFDGLWGFRILRNFGDGDFREDSVFVPPPEGINFPYAWWIDWDRDGRLDLLAGTRLLRNEGRGLLIDAGAEFPAPPAYASGIADIDRDGDWDLPRHRNNGDGTWAELPWDANAAVAWGDFNADGLPDAATTGTDWVEQPGGGFIIADVIRLWRNAGGGSFELRETLAGAGYATLRWADINNDGRLDLLANGILSTGAGAYTSHAGMLRAYCQRADGTFYDAAPAKSPLGWGPVDAADFDADGDLDLVLGGTPGDPLSDRRLYYLENAAADSTGRGNNPPSAPTSLRSAAGTGSLELRWDASADDHTPSAQIAYELRVGTQPGLGDIVSANAGMGQTPLLLAGGVPGATLRGLAAGTYRWSVRAIDPAGAVSPWSPEAAATVAAGDPPLHRGDANKDAAADAADIVRAARMAAGQAEPDPAVADANFDGSVTSADFPPLVLALFGVPVAPLPEGTINVGGEGGTVAHDNVALTIPPGAIARGRATIRISPSDENSLGWDGAIGAGPVRRITGIPEDTRTALQLAVRDNRANPSYLPELYIAEPGYSAVSGEGEHYRRLPLASYDWPWLAAAIDPPGGPDTAARADADGTYSYGIAVLGGYGYYTTAHFQIAFPSSANTALIESLGTDLEDAHARFQTADIAMSYAPRIRYPIEVTVRTLASTTYGEAYNSIRGDNYGGIDFNILTLSDAAGRRATAFHEFFHLVQSWYDPRNRYSKAKRQAPHYLLDEATAAWAEQYSVPVPATYSPSVTTLNWTAPFATGGWRPAANAEKSVVRDHGYGFASLMKFIERRRNSGAVRTAYEEIAAGRSWVRAMAAASGDTSMMWVPLFYAELLEGKLYPPSAATTHLAIPTNQRTLRLSASASVKVVQESLPALSGRLFAAYAAPDFAPELRPTHRFGMRVDGTTDIGLHALSAEEEQLPKWLGSAPVLAGISRYLVADAQGILSRPDGRILALVANDDSDEYAPAPTPVRVTLALLEDLDVALPTATIYGQFLGNQQFPAITLTGARLTLPASAGLVVNFYDPISYFVDATVWEDDGAVIGVHVPATLGNTAWTDPTSGIAYTVPGIDRYRLTILKLEGQYAVPVSEMVSTDGNFSVPVAPIGGMVIFSVYAEFRILGDPEPFEQSWPVATFFGTAM